MSRALATRLKKIEAKRRGNRRIAPIIFGLFDDEGGGEVIALTNNGDTVDRLYGETDLGAFAHRASAVVGGAPILLAVYPPTATPEPSPALQPPPVAPIEPPARAALRDMWPGG